MTDISIGEESPEVKKQLLYDERPVLKFEALTLEPDEYLLKEVSSFPEAPSSPVGRALPFPKKLVPQLEVEDQEYKPDLDMSVSDFYASVNPFETPKMPKVAESLAELPEIPNMVPPVSPAAMPKAADIAAVLELTEQLAAVELEAKKKEEKPKAKKTKKFKKDNTENEELYPRYFKMRSPIFENCH